MSAGYKCLSANDRNTPSVISPIVTPPATGLRQSLGSCASNKWQLRFSSFRFPSLCLSLCLCLAHSRTCSFPLFASIIAVGRSVGREFINYLSYCQPAARESTHGEPCACPMAEVRPSECGKVGGGGGGCRASAKYGQSLGRTLHAAVVLLLFFSPSSSSSVSDEHSTGGILLVMIGLLAKRGLGRMKKKKKKKETAKAALEMGKFSHFSSSAIN